MNKIPETKKLDASKKTAPDGSHRRTHGHTDGRTDGNGDSMTESAQ